MSKLDRVRQAEREIQHAALERWRSRARQREQHRVAIAGGGVGSADSPQRNARYRNRQAGLEALRALGRAGKLPIGIERKLGATLDFTPFAPNDAARTAGRPVARIVEIRGVGVEPEGIATGFLIAPRLLMTNHHVFQTESDAFGTGANFLYEHSDRGVESGIVFEIDAATFFLADAQLDFAIVAVKPRSLDGKNLSDLGAITLIEATPKILKGQPINIIQHPEGRPKQYAISENRLIDILDQEGFLHYETDTLRGSSGSPAFNEAWELVGLHHASIPATAGDVILARNGGPWSEEMGDDQVRWIANEGTRVSAMVARLAATTLDDPQKQAILHELLATTTDPVDDVATPGAEKHIIPADPGPGNLAPRHSGETDMAHNHFHFSGPVTINVLAPAAPPTRPTIAANAEAAIVAVEKVIRFDPNYKNRKGYDPTFLDPEGTIAVPTPSVVKKRAGELLKGADGSPLVLKYHHFELVMNEPRRLLMWSAANVDYDEKRKLNRDRKEFGSDKWIPDKRIAAELQIFDADFYKPAGNIDRGHIVRREDNAWGDTEEEIEFANSDTFHWTNCTPQHEAFNQAQPGRNDRTYRGMTGIWGDLENYIQQSRKGTDTKACILAGPILAADDPSEDFGNGRIQYPLRFWKVVCIADPDEEGGDPQLKVFGFILDQSDVVQRFGIERFEPGRFARYQVPLREITEEAGIVFSSELMEADTK